MIPTSDADSALMRAVLQRIATGPELSKDISREEARAAMRLVLESRVDPVQAGVFLVALRMKRETDDELLGLFDALREATRTIDVSVDELIDISDPYDGYARTLPIAAFLPALLAACGLPAVSHGVQTMGPKYGVTHAQVLRAAGARVDGSLEQAAARLADPSIGWAYVDQNVFCPALYRLATLRSLIVKRPALTTLEVLLRPIRARRKTHAVTGYVHKAYPRIYALVARAAGFDSALIVRGIEGGVIPSLRQEGRYFSYRDGGEEHEERIEPKAFGFTDSLLPPAAPTGSTSDDDGTPLDAAALAATAAESGGRALKGEPGATRDNLVAAAALCLYHVGRYPSPLAAAAAARAALDTGRAHRNFSLGRS